jgi:hypothetical protein
MLLFLLTYNQNVDILIISFYIKISSIYQNQLTWLFDIDIDIVFAFDFDFDY